MIADPAALDRTIATLTARLLERRNAAGWWEGRLASSALSTATAIIALELGERSAERDTAPLVRAGVAWLIANQNEDGGWGDTVSSFSNLSTTALCWAALKRDPDSRSVARAEAWLRAHVGDLSPDRVRTAIVERYGKDRTFSVPILTALTLAGRLGHGVEAWRGVPQLPFELVACPHQFFQWLRLPVVSYALPALVAIGQVRHHQAPSRNSLMRVLRTALRPRTLAQVRQMQPASGGFLEATPLTAFVVMSLIGAGEANDPVVRDGIRFLAASTRPDGSWPIDTNLATWVTTLAVKALVSSDVGSGFSRTSAGKPALLDADRARIVRWLLDQQYTREHPFTHAAPGGWAWTDLPGGVPDADDTSGALLALATLARGRESFPPSTADCATQLHRSGKDSRPLSDAAAAGVEWLLDLQNRDGGIPTFCRGWGALPFDRSAPELTAHALQAWDAWHEALAPPRRRRVRGSARRAVDYLAACQNVDGSWIPLWFGNQHVRDQANPTYATARVIIALGTGLARASSAKADRLRERGRAWLLGAQNADGGWGGVMGAPSSIEETGVALEAIGRLAAKAEQRASDEIDALGRGVRWIVAATSAGRHTPASPIGLYFARLWYSEDLYPLVFALAGLGRARSALVTCSR